MAEFMQKEIKYKEDLNSTSQSGADSLPVKYTGRELVPECVIVFSVLKQIIFEKNFELS